MTTCRCSVVGTTTLLFIRINRLSIFNCRLSFCLLIG
jgi:hypothetical protein